MYINACIHVDGLTVQIYTCASKLTTQLLTFEVAMLDVLFYMKVVEPTEYRLQNILDIGKHSPTPSIGVYGINDGLDTPCLLQLVPETTCRAPKANTTLTENLEQQ